MKCREASAEVELWRDKGLFNHVYERSEWYYINTSEWPDMASLSLRTGTVFNTERQTKL